MRPRLLGGALQRHARTIRHNPPIVAEDDIPSLHEDEDWFPLYVLEASRHKDQTEEAPYSRDFIVKSQFVDMTQDAWMQELKTMGVPFDSTDTIHHLLSNATNDIDYRRYV